jgi:hypothetical protein
MRQGKRDFVCSSAIHSLPEDKEAAEKAIAAGLQSAESKRARVDAI